MIVVMIVPTGIGAEIGGHSGDATPAAKLLAECCDILISHPNVFNAADINEIPNNCLYVEGSILDHFLEGDIELQPVKQNKILLVVNHPVNNDTINSVNAARSVLGAQIDIMVLNTPLTMEVQFREDGSATGDVTGWEDLVTQVAGCNFDALAIQTPITCDPEIALNYAKEGGVNPWGGVEAYASKLIANAIYKPVAHAPVEFDNNYTGTVDPRMAAEYVSISYLHCVLKGLHRAPRISHGHGISIKEVDALVTPDGCWGAPHSACLEKGIPIITVRENQTIYNNHNYHEIRVENYFEAAGYLMCMKAGILPSSVRR